MSQKKLIHGFHAVNARLFQSPKSLIEIYITRGREDRRMQEALAKAADEGIRVIPLDNERLDAMTGHARHQEIGRAHV